MKTIKIKFVGFRDTINENDNIIVDILKKHYNVTICDDADYIFCGIFGAKPKDYAKGVLHLYCGYPQVRILLDGENLVPDFNIVDYAVSSYPINYFDRHFSLPGGVQAFYQTGFKNFQSLPVGKRNFTKDDLDQKTLFATFLANHESEYGIRGGFFKKLSEYKFIASPGAIYHNTDENIVWSDDSKCEYIRKGKFSLCFESTKHDGFITEKLVDAFYANTVPVYYGSSNVSDIFNTKAFINCGDYDNFDDAIKAIIDIDNDDEKYIKMLQEPIFVNENYQKELMEGFEEFLLNIFEQPLELAYRRSRIYKPKNFDEYLCTSQKYMTRYILPYLRFIDTLKHGPKRFIIRTIRRIKRLIRKILGNEKYENYKHKIKR